jgi:hypothetical protein
MTDLRPMMVNPAWIEEQRELGWPDMHPEDFCHICGIRNPTWFISRKDWLIGTLEWAIKTGREGICCPTCFQEMYEEATGVKTVLKFRVQILK